MRILFVVGRCPLPALRGDQVRATSQLVRLARRHELTLVAPRSAGSDLAALRAVCRDVVLVPREPLDVPLAAAGLAAGVPAQVAWFAPRSLQRTVSRLARPGAFDVIHVQLARLAPVAERLPSMPRVLDLVDALSLNMSRRAEHDRGPGRWAARWEARRLARYEQELCAAWPRLTVVSEDDRQALGAPASVVVNGNGVDLDAFARPDERRERATVVFTGNLGYFANVDAVRWFVDAVWGAVGAQEPAARLRLVGARPDPSLVQLARRVPGVELVGGVADLAAELARATVAVAPLRAGSGHPLKVLEAMAAGTPVVCTSRAFGGIGAIAGRHALVEDTAEGMAAAVVRLLRDGGARQALATAARAHVAAHHTWDHSVSALEEIYSEVVAPSQRSASRA